MRTILALLMVATLLSASATALPTPGVNGELTNTIPVVGRVFPEPLMTNDYIGYKEAIAGLQFLNRTYPDRVEFVPVGKSVGWTNRFTNVREPQTVFLVEVTNEKSPLAKDHKLQLLFMLSIHGNEKGGREGGFRVIEDFAKGNVGLLAERPDLMKLLDYVLLIFLFPNADGWTHDEPEYFGPGGTMYTRANANGVDMNRQWPTTGFMQADRSHQTVSEPEIHSITNYLKDNYKNVVYGSDIHGMLNPADGNPGNPTTGAPQGTLSWLNDRDKGHYILGLLPAAQQTQLEIARTTRLGELVRERLNAYTGFAPWTALPSTSVWGGNFVRWGTVWETINYQVSGGSHDWFVGDRGLNAPSFSFEMSYNHIVCDAMYPGCGASQNYFHVNAVRQIVATFMEAATKDFQVSIDTKGHRAGYLYNPKVFSSAKLDPPGGWAAQTSNDDRWEYTNDPYEVSPNEYLADLAQYVKQGDKPGVFESVRAQDVNADNLARFDTFVIAGSSGEQVAGNPTAISALRAWVEAGGSLVLTDSSLRLAEAIGAVGAGQVKEARYYMGHTNIVDKVHPMSRALLGFSRQTYETVPIGHQLGNSGASNFYIDAGAVQQAKGSIVGVLGGSGVAAQPTNQANYGEIPVGKGKVRYLGALLPDPSQEFYHPYGLAGHAVTYAGNHFFVNMLDFEFIFEAPPVVLENLGKQQSLPAPSQGPAGSGQSESSGVPGFEWVALLGAAGLVAVALRRKSRSS